MEHDVNSDTGSESVTLASSLSKIAAECGDAALRVASAGSFPRTNLHLCLVRNLHVWR
jgi:hypothetical protein